MYADRLIKNNEKSFNSNIERLHSSITLPNGEDIDTLLLAACTTVKQSISTITDPQPFVLIQLQASLKAKASAS